MKRALVRAFAVAFTRTFYRLQAVGRENVPRSGGALLVSNHLSLVDVLLICAAIPRPVRFVLAEGIFRNRLVRACLKLIDAIALPVESRTKEVEAALDQAARAIAAGELVAIFAERNISRIGILLPFRAEFERILQKAQAQVIPICLDGVWGSVFSYQSGRVFWKLPRRFPYPARLEIGKPMPASSKASEVRAAVQELQTSAWPARRRKMKTLDRAYLQKARAFPFQFAMADGRQPGVRFLSGLAKALYLGRRLGSAWEGQEMVGILLPPSVAGALVNLAALLSGKIPVNLNYTLSQETLESCIAQCGLKTVVTSKLFLDRVKLNVGSRAVLLEQVAAEPRLAERLSALFMASFAPARLLDRWLKRERAFALDDLATVIFSSGSTGQPKGIMLTHYNVASNVQQLAQVFDFQNRDRFLGILPFFHSFGFTATLIAPAVLGLGVAFHANPLEGKAIGELVRRYALTYLMATPAFLQIYLRSCEPGDFGSLRFVMTGAEKLPEWLATAFEEKFGIRPLEGYGCTECAPVVTTNTTDFRAAGLRQVGGQRGRIGHPLPGVSVRIVDPETRQPLGTGKAGLLLVRGPNVMKGYLGAPEKTSEVLHEGWYVTGDVAVLHEDGFLEITDRLSRFSKIGGEMAPHVKVEEKLHELAGVTEEKFAVTAVPDEKKGERLVVLHTLEPEETERFLKKLPQIDLPNLWAPRPNQFFRVEAIPHLGTGKLDLRRIREMALAFSKGQRSEP